jgi:hypothetical protein
MHLLKEYVIGIIKEAVDGYFSREYDDIFEAKAALLNILKMFENEYDIVNVEQIDRVTIYHHRIKKNTLIAKAKNVFRKESEREATHIEVTFARPGAETEEGFVVVKPMIFIDLS